MAPWHPVAQQTLKERLAQVDDVLRLLADAGYSVHFDELLDMASLIWDLDEGTARLQMTDDHITPSGNRPEKLESGSGRRDGETAMTGRATPCEGGLETSSRNMGAGAAGPQMTGDPTPV